VQCVQLWGWMGPRRTRCVRRRRRGHVCQALATFLAVALVGALEACAFHRPPSNPDPGNRHLNELAADPIFATLPPHALVTGSLVLTPASQTSVFGGHVWNGPAVTLRFTSTQPPSSVFTYYADLAHSAGWVPNGNKNVLGYPEVWDKSYPGGVHAGLSLIDMDIRGELPGTASTYVLNGSA
jgi:hypothetical protein